MVSVARPAVRVLCLDAQQRLLLLRWRDPADGTYLWEPPGGGIEPGERPIDAARRELQEETGLPGGSVLDRHVTVGRDVVWNGQRYQGQEAFFLARVDQPGPLDPEGMTERERGWLQGHAWVAWSELAHLADRVEPPQLAAVLAALDPSGPWSAGHGPASTPESGVR